MNKPNGMPKKIQDRFDSFLEKIGDGRTYEIKNESDGEATIYLYDVIGEGFYDEGISAKQFANDLDSIKASTIHLRINSPGGDVFDARAMQTALNQKDAKIIAHIDGWAASAATYIMLAADEIEASEGAIIMIHNAWGMAVGNKNEMRDMADLLAKIDDGIAKDYIDKTDQSPEQITTWMDAETDFTAQEALDAGFIDSIYVKPKAKATKRNAEKALRDAGMTRAQARDVLAEGWKGTEQRDAAEPDAVDANKEIADYIQRKVEILKGG